jgi:hypothetical protein
MTARQPPGEKGAKACTTGLYQSRDWYFCACFPGEYQKRGAFLYSEQHIVKTKLGTFSLDDAAYAAYLEGKLWINWSIGNQKKDQMPGPAKPFIPLNVSDEAVRLRDAAAKQDVYFFLQEHFPGKQISVPYKQRMQDLPIEEMNLSVRSSNALMRANAKTFGRVKEIIMMEDGLKKIRNLGIKSEREIIRNFFSACYCQLSPTEQAIFWQKVIEQAP